MRVGKNEKRERVYITHHIYAGGNKEGKWGMSIFRDSDTELKGRKMILL